MHGGSAAGSLLDSVNAPSLLQLAVELEGNEQQRRGAQPRAGGDAEGQYEDPVAKYLRSLAAAPRATGFLSDKHPAGLRKTVSLDSGRGARGGVGAGLMCATGGLENGLCSPLGSGSHGSAATGFSGLSARFGSLHVASSPVRGSCDPALRGGSLSVASSGPLGGCASSPCYSDGSAEASMRGGVPRLASTPSFGSMPMLSTVASSLMMATGSAGSVGPPRPRRVNVVHHSPLAHDDDDMGPLAVPDLPTIKLDEDEALERCTTGSFHAPSVLDELDAGGAPPLSLALYSPAVISQYLFPRLYVQHCAGRRH